MKLAAILSALALGGCQVTASVKQELPPISPEISPAVATVEAKL